MMSLHAVLVYGSVLLAAMQLLSNWLLKGRRRAGWAIVAALTVIGLWYDWRTAQYGYIGLAFFNIPVAYLAWKEWGGAQ